MIKIVTLAQNYKTRANGWVQDSSDFGHLWDFCNAFDEKAPKFEAIKEKIKKYVVPEKLKSEFLLALEKPHEGYSYAQIVGHHSGGKSRKTSTVCNGIGQAAVEGQTRDFLGDWPTDNFLRWAYLLGFVEYNIDKDTYSISETGKAFAREADEKQRNKYILNSVLSYPPARRIIQLLKDKPAGLNKFEIGEQLGCIGEKGFTNIGSKLFNQLYLYSPEEDRKSLLSDREGSSDKYARQICSWLKKLNLVSTIKETAQDLPPLQRFILTPLGLEEARKLDIHKKINVLFSMLSMDKGAEVHMKRRALILYYLQEKNIKDFGSLSQSIKKHGISASEDLLQDDIESLTRCGIRISVDNGEIKLLDVIENLEIPDKISASKTSIVEQTKNSLRPLLKHVDHDLLKLIDFAYDGKRSSAWFENYTWKVYQTFCKSVLLGGASRPDVIAEYENVGIIIDSKAYKNGFSASRSLKDEMIRYVNEAVTTPNNLTVKWWENFSPEIQDYVFQYVSTSFAPEIKKQLADISAHAYGKNGSAITAENLLLLAEAAATKKIDPSIFSLNDVIQPSNF